MPVEQFLIHTYTRTQLNNAVQYPCSRALFSLQAVCTVPMLCNIPVASAVFSQSPFFLLPTFNFLPLFMFAVTKCLLHLNSHGFGSEKLMSFEMWGYIPDLWRILCSACCSLVTFHFTACQHVMVPFLYFFNSQFFPAVSAGDTVDGSTRRTIIQLANYIDIILEDLSNLVKTLTEIMWN